MKEIIFIKGKKIDLCIMNQELHLENCAKWLNDPEINKWLTTGIFPIYYSDEKKWFEKLGSRENVIFAIVTKDGKYIGNVGLHKIDFISRSAEMGIFIGDKSQWGNGIATEAEKLITVYGFDNLNLQKIYAKIFTDNLASQKAVKKNGAVVEGTLKKHVYKNGKYNDVVCIAFFKE